MVDISIMEIQSKHLAKPIGSFVLFLLYNGRHGVCGIPETTGCSDRLLSPLHCLFLSALIPVDAWLTFNSVCGT